MILIPKISPITFKQDTLETVNVPKDQGGQYYGVDYISYCNEWVKDTDITIQINSDDPVNVWVNNNPIIVYDITPSPWTGPTNYVYQCSYTPTTVGSDFQFKISDGTTTYFSDTYVVVENQDNALIKINYAHNENDFGMVSGQGFFTTFVYGTFIETLTPNEITTFKNTRNQTVKLRATPIEKYKLSMFYLKYNDLNKLNLIFSCSDVAINELEVTNDNSLEATKTDTSDIFEANIDLERRNDNFMVNFENRASGVLVGDNSDDTIGDNNLIQII